jgi:hypothetical protein
MDTTNSNDIPVYLYRSLTLRVLTYLLKSLFVQKLDIMSVNRSIKKCICTEAWHYEC